MPAPTFTRPIQGTAPNQFVENTADVAALNATLEALWLAIVSGGSEEQIAELVDTLTGLRDAAQTAATNADVDADRAEAARDEAQSSARTVATWAALAALTGSQVGEGAEVLDSDTGTHTDPVVGGTVANAGRYTWSADPAGWQRIGNTGLTRKADVSFVNKGFRTLRPMQVTRGFTTTTGGALVEAADYEISDFIDVETGDVITYTGVTSTQPNINGYDADGVWIADLNPFTTGNRILRTNVEVTIPAGVKLVRASSAFDNSAGSQFAKSPLILKKNGEDIGPWGFDIAQDKHEKVQIDPPLIRGQTVLAGTGLPILPAPTYHRTDFVRVIPGETIFYTGVASSSIARVKGFDADFEWVSDLYVATNLPSRSLVTNVRVLIPSGVEYIVATSSYLPEGSFAFHPLVLERSLGAALKLLATPGSDAQSTSTPVFRSMCYNIYIGGRDATGREAVMRHIRRARPDILSIQEAGSVSTIRPLLEQVGFEHFYGPGGGFGLYFASKHPITYEETLTSVNWDRKPLYTEVLIGGKTVGIVSVHLDSGCSGMCHDPDFRNVVSQEPSGQRRVIQMYQIMDFLNARKVANPDVSGFIIQGDYNAPHDALNVVEYNSPIGETSLPSGLSYPLPHRQFPFRQFAFFDGNILLDIEPAPNGQDFTWWGPPLSPNPVSENFAHRLDYIAHSDSLVKLRSEVLNSVVDHAMPEAGVPKFGGPLLLDDGYVASDHLPVVADFIIL